MNTIFPTWQTYDNIELEDCYCAAAGHLIRLITGNEPSEAAILSAFHAITEGQDIPEPERKVLNYWRDTGIAGHLISGWSLIDHLNHEKVRRHIRKHGLYVVLNLPDKAENDTVWSFFRGPYSGHYVAVVDVCAMGPICVTWGKLRQMTWEFWDSCVVTAETIHLIPR